MTPKTEEGTPMDQTVASFIVRTHGGDVEARVKEGMRPGKLDLEISVGGVHVVIYFDSLEQLQEFDESCHGAIEEALFDAQLGQAQDEDQAEREAAERAADDSAEITAEMDVVFGDPREVGS